jgi:hypothetical protein
MPVSLFLLVLRSLTVLPIFRGASKVTDAGARQVCCSALAEKDAIPLAEQFLVNTAVHRKAAAEKLNMLPTPPAVLYSQSSQSLGCVQSLEVPPEQVPVADQALE